MKRIKLKRLVRRRVKERRAERMSGEGEMRNDNGTQQGGGGGQASREGGAKHIIWIEMTRIELN